MGIGFGNNTFVAVGNDGNLIRSTDNGTTFDNVTNHPVVNGQFMDVAFSE